VSTKKSASRFSFTAGACLALAGCIGSDRVAFVTVDNLGVAIESTPYPLVDIGFSRTEAVVQPVFEDGRVTAVAAAAAHDVAALVPFSIAHIAVFAGGAAAAGLVRDAPSVDGMSPEKGRQSGEMVPDRSIGAACISRRPRGWDGRDLPENGSSNPMIFGTTTTIGFRLALPPQNAASGFPVPNMNLGYRRAEVALAPMLGQPGGCREALNGGGPPNTYQVNSPSFIGVFRSGQASGEMQSGQIQGGFGVGQVFATGAAATHVAASEPVRSAYRTVTRSAAQPQGGRP
jgi:hypothetical protein